VNKINESSILQRVKNSGRQANLPLQGICLSQLSGEVNNRYSVGIRARWPGFDSRQGQEIFFSSTASRSALESTHPPIQRVAGALSLRIKQ
jgi:hypothetical protein